MKYLRIHILTVLVFLIYGCRTPSATPILVLATPSGFGNYVSEILKTEGFTSFASDSLHSRDFRWSLLNHFDIVVLAEPVDPAEAGHIKTFINKGGRIVSVVPQPGLAGFCGLQPAGMAVTEGYLAIDTATNQGHGLTAHRLRLHGTVQTYHNTLCKVLATLYADPFGASGFPAVVSKSSGKGQFIMFLYNLPQTVVYTHQGNPAFAGLEKDGIPGLRGMDLFADGWVDTSQNTLNQADIQMTLFAHCLEGLSQNGRPLPRLWYFPGTSDCLVTLNNDGEYRSEADFEPQLSDVWGQGGLMSLYLLEVAKTTPGWNRKWIDRNFEISGHPDDTRHATDPTWADMDSALAVRRNQMKDMFNLPMHTVVNHWFVWCGKDSSGRPDFGAQARLEEKYGIGLDANYAHYDRQSTLGKNYLGPDGYNQGNFTGSGMVMHYTDINGKITDVFQHPTAVYDQQYMETKDPEAFFESFRGLLERSLNQGTYSFIGIKAHNDEYAFSKEPLLRMIALAKSLHVPVWTEHMLLDFLKKRYETDINYLNWNGHTLEIRVSQPDKIPADLTCLIPLAFGSSTLKAVVVNKKPVACEVKKIKGISYALVPLSCNNDLRITYQNNPKK
jgi:hypothetical protein